MIMAQKGNLEVWWVTQYSRRKENVRIPVKDIREATSILMEYTNRDLDDNMVEWNAGGLDVFDGEEWIEWYDDKGNDIYTLMDEGLDDVYKTT